MAMAKHALLMGGREKQMDKWHKLKDCILWKSPCLFQQVAYTAKLQSKCNELKVSSIADLGFIE